MKTSVITLSLVLAASQLTLVPEAHAGRGNRALIGGLIGAAIGAAIYHNSRNKKQGGGKKRQPQAAVNSDVYPRTLGNWTIDYDAENRICLASSVSANGTSYHIGMAAKDGDWFFSFTNPDWKAIEEGRVYQNIDYVFDRRKGFNGESTGISNGLLIDGLNEEFVQHFARANKLAVHLDKNPVDEIGLRGTKNAVSAIRHCTKQAQKQQPAPVMAQDLFNSAPSPLGSNAFAAEQPVFPAPPAAPPPVAPVAVAQAAPVVPVQQVELDAETAAERKRLNAKFRQLIDAELYVEAEQVAKQLLNLDERSVGPDHRAVGASLSYLAKTYMYQGRYAEVEPLLQRSLAIMQKTLGPEHPDGVIVLHYLAQLYYDQGRYAEAEPLFQRTLAIREKTLGPEHRHVANSLDGLALLYQSQGRYTEAEPLFQRALAILEALGPETPGMTSSLNGLALIYDSQGRYAEAESLYQRVLAIQEKALGPEHSDVATILNNLASLYHDQGRYAMSEPLYQRALAIREKALGPEHPNVAISLSNLAELYSVQGRYADAEALHQRALAILEAILGPEHTDVAVSLIRLASLYDDQGRYADAEPLYQRALLMLEKAQGPEHPNVANSLHNLAVLYYSTGKPAEELALRRRVLTIDASRLEKGTAGKQGGIHNRIHALEYLPLLAKRETPDAQDQADRLTAMQLAQRSDTAEAFQHLAQRLAAGGQGGLAESVRQRQDLLQQLEAADKRLLEQLSKPQAEQNTELTTNLRNRVNQLQQQLEQVSDRLHQEFPSFAEFEGSQLADLPGLQKVLAPKEAALAWVLGEEKSYLLIVPKSGEPKLRALPLGQAAVQGSVDQLHQALDLAHESHPGQLARFPAAKAHELFGQLFGADWQQDLEGIDHLLLVPEGPLSRLPFAALLTDTPAQADFPSRGEQYPQAPWLAKRFGLSVLPSLSSIVALRSSTGEGADKPFLGIGDPLLDDHPARSGKLAAAGNPGLFRNVRALKRVPDPAASPDQQRQQLLQQLRSQPSLPDTAAELEAIAATLGSDKNSALLLRERANEFQLKQTPLHGYQVISFATHGVLAGELGKGIEPGLILTPPAKASAEDDGFLSLSEVAGLKLNADWVVLSACNTAAGADQDSDGLTGLARAFIYAGAKSLLVSHWAVSSQATVGLMQGLFANYQKQNLPKHKAHQLAMLSMINSGDPQLSHPSMWAPFVLVGADG
jgi:CHAT domain-containing protein